MHCGRKQIGPFTPADIYLALGPITDQDREHLAALSPKGRQHWFTNIYGRATARYARFQYKTGTR